MLFSTPLFVIARYEAKTLLRSWLFRIFASLALIIIVLLDIAFFVFPQSSKWMYYGIPSGIPYMNLLLLNVFQAIICIFTASDFLKNDDKFDSTDVIYMRSMTNASYIIGKVIGLFTVFLGINIFVAGIALLFNVFFANVPVVAEAYILYPLLLNIPTLVFVIGLTVLLMTIMKNQAVTIVVLIGYCLITIFFLNNRFYHLLDYIALSLPFLYSDFVGFGDLNMIIIQRTIYFVLGIGFVFTAVLLIPRPLQSRLMHKASILISAVCYAAAVLLGMSYLSEINDAKELRLKMSRLNDIYAEAENISIVSTDIELNHTGLEVSIDAILEVINKSDRPIEKFLFTLNPGLAISGITSNGSELRFERNLHILTVSPDKPLQPEMKKEITISYHGKINEEANYYYVDEDIRAESFSFFMYNINKRHSFITPDYVLLTPENLWYPVAGVISHDINSDAREKSFVQFSLTVHTANWLTPVSQGAVSNPEPGTFKFHPEGLLPQLSLAIGNYDSYTATENEIDYAIYFLKGHDFFSQYFEEIKEFIPGIIGSALSNYEFNLGLEYPYRRLAIVETPVQFYSYQHLLTSSTEYVQPELIFFHEKGILLESADFRSYINALENQAQNSGRGSITVGAKLGLIRSFIEGTFFGGSSGSFASRALRRPRTQSSPASIFSGSDEIQLQLSGLIGLLQLESPETSGMYSVFPMLYSQVNHFTSGRWPLFNTAIEFYLMERIRNQSFRGSASSADLSDQDRANLALMDQSLSDMISNPRDIQSIANVLEQKIAYLFMMFQSEMEMDSFDSFLNEYLASQKYSDNGVEEFLALLESTFDKELTQDFDSWFYQEQLPAYIIDGVESYEVIDGQQTRYQVVFDIYNPEPVDGLILVQFRTSSRSLGGRFGGGGRGGGRGGRNSGGFGGSNSDDERIIKVSGMQYKRVGILLDNQPIGMTVSTLISQNLPSVMEINFGQIKVDLSVEPFEGEIILADPMSYDEPGEVIVDNEDPGFIVNASASDGYLKRLINASIREENEYTQLRLNNLPKTWKSVISTNYYGLLRQSARYIKSGTGLNSVSWNAVLEQNGEYDIYFYIAPVEVNSRGGGQRGRGARGGGRISGGGGRGGGTRGGGGGQVGRGGFDVQSAQSGGRGFFARFGRSRNLEDLIKDFNFRIHHDIGIDKVMLNAEDADAGWNLLGTYYLSRGETTVELSDRSEGQLVYADAIKWVKRK